MQKDVKHTWFFSQPPQEVWDYLTIPELIGQWLMTCDFKPVAGSKFQFINKDKVDAYCQVMEVVPLKRLSYKWLKGVSENEITVDSLVTWTLTPKNGGTELHLVHNGFTVLEETIKHEKGWEFCMNRMIGLINSVADANT